MVQAQTLPLTFEEFLAADPEDGGIDAWVNGEVVAVEPTSKHEEAIAFKFQPSTL